VGVIGRASAADRGAPECRGGRGSRSGHCLDGPAGRFSASSGEPLALPDIPPELGRAYDGGVLAELAPAVASAGIPLDELRGWVEKGHWQMVKGIRPTVDERDAKLREWFGHQARACVDDARSVLSRLPPQTREAVSGWIDRTGLRYSAPFTAWLASHGARLKTRPGG
jgi:hypothetical protein